MTTADGKRSLIRRLLRGFVIFAVVPYVVIIVLLAVFQRSLIYGPVHDPSLNVRPARIPGARVESISLLAADNVQLNGWNVIADTAGTAAGHDESRWSHGKPLILYFCGNAGNRADRVEEFQIFAGLGIDAICFDYRGYGDNAGSPGEAVFAEDARAIWRYVTQTRGVDPRRVIIFGESLGGGVATRLASELSNSAAPPAGLVLRSTFTRLTDVAAGLLPWLPVRWLMFDRYPSVERIARVNCPILIFHGRRDATVPFALGERLFSAAPEQSSQAARKRFIALETADHNDVLLTERDAFRAGMQEFLEQVNPQVDLY